MNNFSSQKFFFNNNRSNPVGFWSLLIIPILTLLSWQQASAQYPSIPGNPTTFQNNNSPDPFGGVFYNGSSPVYTIPDNGAYCIDRATPVCDGTKIPLSPGSVNTKTELAAALYLANFGNPNSNPTEDERRNLIWAILGQPSNCSGNPTCTKLYNEAILYSSGTLDYSLTYSPIQSAYKTGDKIIFEINTNLPRFQTPILSTNLAASQVTMSYCDASGNTISQPSFITTAQPLWEGGIVVKNNSAPSSITLYICMEFTGTGTGFSLFNSYPDQFDNFTLGASDVSVWSANGCQSLAYLMPPPRRATPQFDVTCDAITDVVVTASTPNPSTDLSVTATGINANTTFQWYGPPSSTISNRNSQDAYASVPTIPGEYIYRVEMSNGGTCTATGSVTILVAGPCTPFGTLSTSANPSPITPGGSVSLSVSGSGVLSNTRYDWSGPNSFASTAASPSLVAPSAPGTYTYTVTTTNIGTDTCRATKTLQLIVANGPANLSLKKTVSNQNPTPGSNIVYTLVVTNAGPNIANNVVIKDLLPAGLTFVSVGSGTYVPATGLWTIGTVPVGTTTLTMTVTVN